MNRETFSRLFLFNKTFAEEDRGAEVRASFKDWEVEWDTEVKDQLVNLKKELAMLHSVETQLTG